MRTTVNAVCVVLCLTACSRSGTRAVRISGAAMGTTWSVTVVSVDGTDDTKVTVGRMAAEKIETVEELMSTYREHSGVSRFNRTPPGRPVVLSHHTMAVLSQALEIGEFTGGALDVTVGPLVRAWGFGAGASSTFPPPEREVEKLLAATGHRFLNLDPGASTLTKSVPDLAIDLSAVAKGYAVDCVADALASAGFDAFLVEAGGELRAAGGNAEGLPWRLGVELPRESGRSIHSVVALTDGSLATSGDYRDFYESAGHRVSHIVDPRTGHPVAHGLASVSVFDARCARADALATALLVLGPVEGVELAMEQNIAALFLTRSVSGEIHEKATPAFRSLVDEHSVLSGTPF